MLLWLLRKELILSKDLTWKSSGIKTFISLSELCHFYRSFRDSQKGYWLATGGQLSSALRGSLPLWLDLENRENRTPETGWTTLSLLPPKISWYPNSSLIYNLRFYDLALKALMNYLLFPKNNSMTLDYHFFSLLSSLAFLSSSLYYASSFFILSISF